MSDNIQILKDARSSISNIDTSLVDLRFNELSNLKDNSASETSRELITEALTCTKLSMQKWFSLKDAYYRYILGEVTKIITVDSEDRSTYEEAQELLSFDLVSRNPAEVEIEEIEALDSELNDLLNEFSDSQKIKRKVNYTHIANVIVAFTDMSKSLFHETYRPDYKSFHRETAYEIVTSALKKMDILSLLDDIDIVKRVKPRVRMREYLTAGDKVLAYVEEYIDQLEHWILVAEAIEQQVRLETKNS